MFSIEQSGLGTLCRMQVKRWRWPQANREMAEHQHR